MKILVITGGSSSERKISLMSATQVKKALGEKGYQVTLFDFKKGYPALKKKSKNFDVIFPVIHGEEGEGGKLQKFLSTLDKPFVGGDPKGYQQGWYKIAFKKFCDRNNILTAKWKIVKDIDDVIRFGFPAVLKSSSGGSSREVIVLKTKKDLRSPLFKKLINSKDDLFIEQFLPGTEITVAVLKDKALPIIEITPPNNGWFDYKNKYWGNTKETAFAPSITTSVQKKAQKIAKFIHKTLKLGQFSRYDFIISNNKPYILEVNTIPGLTASSLFPKAAQAIGITFPNLMDKIIKMAQKPLA